MKGKILLVVGLGVGYVLGSRAGREKYDELVAKVQKVWNDPRVQKQASNAREFVKDKAPDVADFLSTNVKRATSRGSSRGSGTTRASTAKPSTTSSTARSSASKPSARKSPGSAASKS
jgi:hypothetical protein